MSTFLAYSSPAAGHLFPLVPGLLALQDRGHEVHVYTASELVDGARAAGLRHVAALDARISDVEVRDYEARSGTQRLVVGFENLLGRGPAEAEDLRRAIAETQPDAVLVDVNAYGAAVAVQRSGLPWATTLPSLLPLPGAGIPPCGLGLAPATGPLGRRRDRVLGDLGERPGGPRRAHVRQGDAAGPQRAPARARPPRAREPARARPRARPHPRADRRAARVPAGRRAGERALRRRAVVGPAGARARVAARARGAVGPCHVLDRVPGRRGARRLRDRRASR